jgi:alpha-1,2-mannosyltransferase
MKLPEGYPRLGLVAGAAMWLLWGLSSALGPGNLDLNDQVIGTDHSAFHTAAVLLSEGRGATLFDYPALAEFRSRQDEIVGRDGFLDPYRNPPFYALLYRPTAGLPYLASYLIWATVGLMTLAGSLRLVHGRKFGKALAWSLSFYPVFAAVSFGQNTLLSLGIFALAYHAIVRDRRLVAGLVAGLLLYKPQLLFGLGLWWLFDVRRNWPALLGVATTSLVLGSLSWLVLPQETSDWLRRLPQIADYDAFEFYNLHNPRGFGDLLTGNRRFGQVVGLLGLGLAAIWLWRFQRRHHQDERLIFAAAVFATLWGSPHTMIYEWALLVLPAIVLWNARPDRRATWTWLFAIAWAGLFVATPLTKGQLAVSGRLFDMRVAIQVSVPLLAWVGWRAERTCGLPRSPKVQDTAANAR